MKKLLTLILMAQSLICASAATEENNSEAASGYETVWSNDFVALAAEGDVTLSLGDALDRKFRDNGKGDRNVASSTITGVNSNLFFRSDCTWGLKKGYGLRQTKNWANVIMGVNGVKAGYRITIQTAEPDFAPVTVATSYADYAELDEQASTPTVRVFKVLKDASYSYTATEGKMPIFSIGKNNDYIKSILVEKPVNTGVKAISAEKKPSASAVKFVKDGKVVISKNGHLYNTMGMLIK